MIILRTGTPGAGKTLNTIAEYLDFKGVVYYLGIPELSPELGWIEITEEDFKVWYKREWEPGSVLIIDEAQLLIPQRTKGAPPDYVEALSKHRHYGVDIVLITQHPSMIDAFARRLVGKHIHFHRPFGLRSTTRFEKETVMASPDRPLDRWGSGKKRVKLDKKIFKLYKSTVLDTQTKAIPFRLVFVLGGIVAGFIFVFSVLNHLLSGSSSKPQVFSSSVPDSVPGSSPHSLDADSASDYFITGYFSSGGVAYCWVSKGADCKSVTLADDCVLSGRGAFVSPSAMYAGHTVLARTTCPQSPRSDSRWPNAAAPSPSRPAPHLGAS